MRGAVPLVVNSRVGIPFKVHIVCGCAGFEVLIDVLVHMFDHGVRFFLASCARGPMGRRLATSMVGAIWKKDFEVERFDLPPLRGGGRRGKLFIVRSVKLWEIS